MSKVEIVSASRDKVELCFNFDHDEDDESVGVDQFDPMHSILIQAHENLKSVLSSYNIEAYSLDATLSIEFYCVKYTMYTGACNPIWRHSQIDIDIRSILEYILDHILQKGIQGFVK